MFIREKRRNQLFNFPLEKIGLFAEKKGPLGTPSIIAKFQTLILPGVLSFPKLAQLNPSATNNDISVLLPQIKINPSDVQMLDCQIVFLCR